ncbi:MAG: flagellar basal body P-ring formation chaperone FlgA [Beijerinckiaceae bacterium]
MNDKHLLPELSGRHFALLTAVSCLILFGLTVANAAAQGRLRPIVQVEDDVVRLGDLIEGAGDRASVAVFGAPQPGASGMISSMRIVAAARDHGIGGIETNGLSTVAVRRIGRTIGAEEIAKAVQQAITTQHQLPGDIEIELNAGQMEIVVESAAREPVAVRSLSYNGASGRFEATFVVPGSRALELNPAKVVGNVTDIVRVPVLSRAVLKGDIVTANDVTLERRRRSELGQDVVTDMAKLAGNAARRAMGRGSLIREADVQRPEAVERNATVVMTFEQPGLQLAIRGKALASGAVGDVIQVQNLSSKKTVEAVITGPNRAAVTGTALSAGQKTTLRGDIRQQ